MRAGIAFDSQEFAWTIASPISLTDPSGQTSTEGASASLTLSATDSSSGTLTYAACGFAPGLELNSATGAITGTVAAGASAGSPYTVTISAADGTYTSAPQTFTWTVNSPITLTGPADQTNNEGDSVSLSISCSDSGGTPMFAATGLPPGLIINASTGAITGTVGIGASGSSPYTVT